MTRLRETGIELPLSRLEESMSDLLSTIAPYIPPTLLRAILADPQVPTQPSVERFPAAVLFADVSGFTPLTEALAQKGAEGPEELTRLLNRYFGRIIGLIEVQGGEVVKFSGDAVTVLFPAGDEPLGHAVRRAQQSAQALQAAIDEFVNLKTSVGTVALRMKISLGAGELLAMQVGGVLDRWEYVVAGDPLRQVAQAESRAKRGEIILSPEAAGLLHPDPLAPRPLPRPDWSAVTDPAALQASLRCYVPGAILGWLEKELYDWLAVLRPMSVLFVRVTGLDYAQDDNLDRLHRFMQAVQRTLYRYHGTLDRLAVDDKGTVMLVLIGAPPFAHADDPLRAARCALDLQALAAQEENDAPSLQLTIGVTTGRVFAGPVGGETRCEYTVMGDTVNLAARLMVQAGPGEILCDFDTYRQARQQVTFDSLPPIRVKGKAGLIRVYQPTGQRPAFSPKEQPSLSDDEPLIDRQEELARLTAGLDAVKDGQARLLVVWGEAGVGKSRLVRQLTRAAREQGLAWLLGGGQSIEQGVPYRAWRDVLAYYFGLGEIADPAEHQARVQSLVQELAPEQMERLPLLNDVLNLHLPDTDLTRTLDPDLRQGSLLSLLLALLQAWAQESPLILVLEDAQWLDSLSWELTAQVARSLAAAGAPLLLLVVTRPLAPDSLGARQLQALQETVPSETLSLAPLDFPETRALIKASLNLAPDGLPDEIAQLVHTRSGGNPLFSQELVSGLREAGLIRLEADSSGRYRCVVSGSLRRATQAMPNTVQGLILARIDRLSPERQLILKVGSVIGQTFSYDALSQVLQGQIDLSDAELEQDLDGLVDLGLLSQTAADPEPGYAFQQVIFQKVAYQTMLFAQRRQLHRAAAEWYEATYADPDDQSALAPHYALLVHHYRRAEEAERERHYAWLAGEQAAAQFANAEALTYLSRALELTPETHYAQRYSLLLAREKVYDFLGERYAQSQDLDSLEELASGGRRAKVALRRANYAEATGDYSAAVEAARSAIRLTQHFEEGEASSTQAAGHLAWGRALWRQGDYAGAQTQLEQALDLARSARARKVQADSLRLLGNVAPLQPGQRGARAYYQRALDIYHQIGDRRGESATLNNLGIVAVNLRDHEEARCRYQQALDVFRQIGDRRGEAVVLGNLAPLFRQQDDYPAARDHYQRSLDIFRQVGDRQGVSTALNNLGFIAAAQGDYEQARAWLTQSLHLGRQIGDQRGQDYPLINLGRVFHQLGDHVRARQHYQDSLKLRREIKDRRGEAEVLAYLALLDHHLGENRAARAKSQEAIHITRELGGRSFRAYALTYLGHALVELGQPDQAAGAYQEALVLRRELDQSNLALESLAGLAAARLAAGEVERAQAHVETILAHLKAYSLDGAEEALRVYLSVYRVLSAAKDPRAEWVLTDAHHLLYHRANQIKDEELQRSFLENVPAHRQIVSVWQRLKGP